ncbi:DUF2922 domain-containing protein [Bacillus massiliglaciei]|uniref:DUF2922 domain-containing protein n=1 Tax=Bacillus massiliglaciei TaxID=1816693 RepID=UPI000A6544BB|nr:DUF2922 domain-containing protein [Bacillus massiliglaciei]
MAKTLEMVFVTEEGKSATIALDNPIEPVDAGMVKQAMEEILTQNIFTSSSGDYVSAKSARLVERNVEDVEIV